MFKTETVDHFFVNSFVTDYSSAEFVRSENPALSDTIFIDCTFNLFMNRGCFEEFCRSLCMQRDMTRQRWLGCTIARLLQMGAMSLSTLANMLREAPSSI